MAEQAGYEPAAEPKGRGVGTRQQLIDAALGLFAVHGYDGVTTRALTRAASVNLAAINYHFGSKQGLYRAVIEDIVAQIQARLWPAADALEAALRTAGDNRAAQSRAVAAFLRLLLLSFIGETTRRPIAGLILREYTVPSAAFPLIYDGAVERMHRALAVIVATASDRPADAPDVILEAHALLGQCLGFAVARVIVCRRMGWDDFSPERMDRAAAAVVKMALAALDLPQVERREA